MHARARSTAVVRAWTWTATGVPAPKAAGRAARSRAAGPGTPPHVLRRTAPRRATAVTVTRRPSGTAKAARWGRPSPWTVAHGTWAAPRRAARTHVTTRRRAPPWRPTGSTWPTAAGLWRKRPLCTRSSARSGATAVAAAASAGVSTCFARSGRAGRHRVAVAVSATSAIVRRVGRATAEHGRCTVIVRVVEAHCVARAGPWRVPAAQQRRGSLIVGRVVQVDGESAIVAVAHGCRLRRCSSDTPRYLRNVFVRAVQRVCTGDRCQQQQRGCRCGAIGQRARDQSLLPARTGHHFTACLSPVGRACSVHTQYGHRGATSHRVRCSHARAQGNVVSPRHRLGCDLRTSIITLNK